MICYYEWLLNHTEMQNKYSGRVITENAVKIRRIRTTSRRAQSYSFCHKSLDILRSPSVVKRGVNAEEKFEYIVLETLNKPYCDMRDGNLFDSRVYV